jgi:RNA-binding protein
MACPSIIISKRYIMTSKQRAYLKSLANNLNPIFQIGKSSLTPEFTAAIDEAFSTKELIKIAVLKNCFDDPGEIAQMVAERTHSQVVQVIGKKIILYKPDKKNPRIILPKAKPETGG